jgi:hypothetical protein
MWNPDTFHADNKTNNIPLVPTIINHILLDLQRQLYATKTERTQMAERFHAYLEIVPFYYHNNVNAVW